MARHVPVEGRKGLYYSDGAKGRVFEVRFRDSDGRDRFEVCGPRMQDAIERQAQVRVALGKGERVAPSRKKFSEVAEEWQQQRNVTERSASVYDGHLRLYVVKRFGRQRIQDITTDNIALWLRGLKGQKGQPLADSTRESIYTVMFQVCEYAANPRRGYLAQNPCAALERGERPRGKKIPVRIAQGDEAERLIANAAPWLAPLIQTSLLTGARVGEVLALRWQDIDFERDEVHVRHSLNRKRELGPTKSGKERTVPLLPALRRVLVEMPSRFAGGFVFQTESGRPRALSTVDQWFGKAREGLSITPRPLRFHDLRHTFASTLLRSGEDIAWVSELLGHANINITLSTYAHVIKREGREDIAAQRLGEALGGWAQ